MSDKELVVGIDLGTTNSEIAAFIGDRVQVIGSASGNMLPSCVGIMPTGELVIGQAARNQQLVYPERTVRSIKRKMGSDEKVQLGDRSFSPAEISSLILRELADWARSALQQEVKKAVITVPAYFSDAQRNATREAGALAGLDVVRILNEPTAASLAYGNPDATSRKLMIYDLGGGTFDVSIVNVQGDVTEVLSSHGNNRLGGDDFDLLLVNHLLDHFREQYGVDLRDGHPAAFARVWWAAEEAKKKLSSEPYVTVREEALVMDAQTPLHLEMEITRPEYEEMIRPLIDKTLESVTKAMMDAGLSSDQLDDILLVGGSTRTPYVSRVLEERAGRKPRQDVHPDLCVALGAGVLASRLAGREVDRVLVDITPYTFGTSFLGLRNGMEYRYCYKAIIEGNTPLPVTRTEAFYTVVPYQESVEVNVFQGEDDDALKNIPVGQFQVNGLKTKEEPNEVLIRMRLDIDGILNVSAIEKKTGLSKQITITHALNPMSASELAKSKTMLEKLFASKRATPDGTYDDEFEDEFEDEDELIEAEAIEDDDELIEAEAIEDDDEDDLTEAEADEGEPAAGARGRDPEWEKTVAEARTLVERVRRATGEMHEEDRADAAELDRSVQAAIEKGDRKALADGIEELKELLFFIEDK